MIAHDQGWETQYCHLKQGSISVKVGDNIQVGDVLGKIGLSGRISRSGEYHAKATMTRDGQIVSELKSAITVR